LELFGPAKVFFLDEVQNVPGWERWVRRMYDDGFKFFITGSNARLLSRELASSLTGRHLQLPMYPFSFGEFLEFRKFGFRKEDFYLTERRAVLARHFSQYLKLGGFPEFLKFGRKEILQGYFNDIVQRDVAQRHAIRDIRQLKELARYLITNAGNLATFNQMKRMTGIRSVNTVIKYLSHLEDAYLLFAVPPFTYSLKRQVGSPFKVYAVDNGLRDTISFTFSKDLGRAYENLVAIELKRRGREIYYWKTPREEVDFVVRDARVSQLIQVCYKPDDTDVRNREIKALLKASKELKCKNLTVITSSSEKEEKADNRKIRFVPLWKWLLSQNT